MRGFYPYFKILPRVRAYVARPFRYGVTGAPYGCLGALLILVTLLVATAARLHGQVDAVLTFHGRDAEMHVANPTTKPLHVSVTLFADSTLTDTVPTRISPAAFTLQPGESQVVRLRLRAIVPGIAYRLGTTFTPMDEAPEPPRPRMRLVLATRLVTRVVVGLRVGP